MVRHAALVLALLAAPALAQETATISVEVAQDAPDADPGSERFVSPATPRQFAQMLLAYPRLRTIEMVECPGTSDDTANLRLGRMIRHAGLDTHVPPGGSVRSGAVELFLAGNRRSADPDAEFAVHAWLDADGREPQDFPPSDPVNQSYLAYYREMGLSDEQAQRFYAMTNSVPHEAARWLSEAEFARYAPLTSPGD